MPGTDLVRGRVYAALLTHVGVEKYFVVVSNNRRNRHFEQVLAVRITTTPKPRLPSVVELGTTEVVQGRVICDDIVELYPDEVRRDLGALSPGAMARVGSGLGAALGL
jgi:mRNA interferase MazF